MSLHSGRYAAVNGVSTIRNWSINDEHNSAVGVASNTRFGKARRRGVSDWTGSFSLFGITPPVMPGQAISFIGYGAPDNDVSGVGNRYSGSGLLQQFALNMNWAGGEIISGQCDFGGNGALAIVSSGGAEITDSTDPELYPIGGAYVEYSTDGSTWNTWTDVAQALWTFINELQTAVNSSTYVSPHLWTARKAGNYDWSLAITEQNSDRSRFQKGQQLWVRLHLDATGSNYWELATGLVKNFTGIVYDRESGRINQQTVNVEMNSNNVDDGSIGHIKKPGGDTVWPI
jgi:hypothetical protein